MTLIANSFIAQNSSFEFWPETDIGYRLNPSWRLSSYTAVTKYHESGNGDLSIYVKDEPACTAMIYQPMVELPG